MKTFGQISCSTVAALFLIVGLAVVNTAQVQAASTITVNSSADTAADDGVCTLREAIIAANDDAASGVTGGECAAGSGTDTIEFNITGTADFTNNSQNGYTIEPQSTLPAITEQVTIDGYSQPGAHANTAISPNPLNGTLLIEIDGSGAGSVTNGLDISPGADDVIIRGLVINSFGFRGIAPNGGGERAKIQGNYIGVDPTGLIDKGNDGTGVQLGKGLVLGGLNPEDRNIISGNEAGGTSPNVGDDDWVIQGNYIGVGADGTTPIPNSQFGQNGALSMDNSSNHLIGGSQTGATNVISGNRSFAIFPDNTNNLVIQGNIIGPDWRGNPIPNTTQLGGIGFPSINGPFINTLVGGTAPGEGNIIAYNNGAGIAIVKPNFNGVPMFDANKISILGNSIYENNSNPSYPLSESGLGIDLLEANVATFTGSSQGPTPNDSSDTDTGPNGYINFPVLNSVTQNGAQSSVNFNLDAADSPTGQYRIEFFSNDTADPSGYGEGQIFLGYTTVSNGNNQTATLDLPLGINLSGKSISATTTAIDNTTDSGFGSTSEFSQVVPATATPSIVSSDNLAGTGDNISAILLITLAPIIVASLFLLTPKIHR